ncbi:arsenate reductase family protein [Aureivirga sp. CE67]|uniref:arsenate reductase family protein n=1 Tax=Aureivirga sp. CE67 TaxID=1788983 RepID=UPI0018CB335E|nr:ArsC/Spx/MgsR family protein [Aureivirga sp. CE67]
MSKQVFYLKTCDTCRRILKEVDTTGFELFEIKSTPITEAQLENMRSLTDSYESLFNKRAKKYTAEKMKEQNLTEEDFKNLILEEYTFLKRPVFIVDDKIFIGNSKKNIEALKDYLK